MGGNSGRKTRLSAIQRELEATACHEAGHTLVALYYNIGFRYVSIIPDEQQNSLGHLRSIFPRNLLDTITSLDFRHHGWFTFPGEKKLTAQMRIDAEHLIIGCLVGREAEARFRGRRNFVGAGRDYEIALWLARKLFTEEEVINAYLKFTLAAAKQFVKTDMGWGSIKAIAKALLAHPRHQLSRREVEETLYQFGMPVKLYF